MGVAGVVILYHPENDVLENIQSYLPYLDKLYVADNTETNLSTVALQLKADSKIHIIYDGNNEGIAKRLNEAATLAIGEGYNWLLTMDQDSCFEEGAMPDYLLCAGSYLHKDNTAMFGVEHERKEEKLIDCTPVELNKVITSGSILNLKLYSMIGDFSEILFIDEVDFDYCYRARLKNYRIVQFKNIFLVHSLGVSSKHRSLKNLQKSNRALHSPTRMYYIVRNFFYVKKHFGKHFPDDIKQSQKGLANRIKNNLLYNQKRWEVLASICKGFFDYKLNKFKY